MKFKIATVSFTKKIEVQVIYPMKFDSDHLRKVAEKTDLSEWEETEWSVDVRGEQSTQVPCAECKVASVQRYGGLKPVHGFFSAAGRLTLNDSATRMVLPEEATWWIATEDDEREERQAEANPNQLTLF